MLTGLFYSYIYMLDTYIYMLDDCVCICMYIYIVLLDSAAERKPDEKLCNCRVKARCPLGGKCLTKEVVYQATVTSAHEKATCIGITGDQFKIRYRNHVSSFKNESKRNCTELSKFIWTLKDRNIDYTLTWNIIARAKAYSSGSKFCNLCITEKILLCVNECRAL